MNFAFFRMGGGGATEVDAGGYPGGGKVVTGADDGKD
jgi:hypothetical protein